MALSPVGIFWHAWDFNTLKASAAAHRVDNATGTDWVHATSVLLVDVDGDGADDIVATLENVVAGSPDVVWYRQIIRGAGDVSWEARALMRESQVAFDPPVVVAASLCPGHRADVLVGSGAAHTVLHAANNGRGAVGPSHTAVGPLSCVDCAQKTTPCGCPASDALRSCDAVIKSPR